MRFAWIVVVALAACRADDWVPAGPTCDPGAWTWTDVVKTGDWQAWSQTRDGCGFPDREIEYRIWAQVGAARTLLFEGHEEAKRWGPPFATTVAGAPALAFEGHTCTLERGAVQCR